MISITCQHCHRAVPYLERRGLCKACYLAPQVRAKYPAINIGKFFGKRDFYGGYDLPAEPTDAAPGSDEKIQTLMERSLAGVSLFHPLDRRMPLS